MSLLSKFQCLTHPHTLFGSGVEDVDDGVDVSVLVEEEFSKPLAAVSVAHVKHAGERGEHVRGQRH